MEIFQSKTTQTWNIRNQQNIIDIDDNKTMVTDKLTEKLYMRLRVHQYIFLVGQMYS